MKKEILFSTGRMLASCTIQGNEQKKTCRQSKKQIEKEKNRIEIVNHKNVRIESRKMSKIRNKWKSIWTVFLDTVNYKPVTMRIMTTSGPVFMSLYPSVDYNNKFFETFRIQKPT